MKKSQSRILTVYGKILLELGSPGSLLVVPTVVNFYYNYVIAHYQ